MTAGRKSNAPSADVLRAGLERAGWNLSRYARTVGVATSTVRDWMRVAGVERARAGCGRSTDAEIFAALRSADSLVAAAETLGYSPYGLRLRCEVSAELRAAHAETASRGLRRSADVAAVLRAITAAASCGAAAKALGIATSTLLAIVADHTELADAYAALGRRFQTEQRRATIARLVEAFKAHPRLGGAARALGLKPGSLTVYLWRFPDAAEAVRPYRIMRGVAS